MADDSAPRSERTGVFAALQHGSYRSLWTASVFASIAYLTVLTARGWVAFGVDNRASTVGLVVFASFLPSLVIIPFVGVFADRYDRRKLLLGLQTIGLLSSLVFAWVAWADIKNPWLMVALAFVGGGARSSATPIEQVLLARVVPERDMLNAVALLQANNNGARLIGPLLTALLLYVGGAASAFLIAALFYAIAISQQWKLPSMPPQRDPTTSNPLLQFADGIRYAAHAPILLAIMLIALLHCLFAMGYDSTLPKLAAERFGATGREYSLLVMAVGAGSLVGTLTLAGLARRAHRGQLLFVTGVLSGVTLIPLAYASSWPAAMLAAAAVGLSQATFFTLTTTMAQLAAPDHVRGRVLALYWGSSGATMGFGALMLGGLADRYGLGLALSLPGLIFAAITVLALAVPAARPLYGRRAHLSALTPA